MHASKPTPAPIVRVIDLGTLSVSGTDMRSIKRIWFHMLQLLEA